MTDADPSRFIGSITQLQYLHRKGRFAVPLRMKLLPSSLRTAGMPDGVSDFFEHLQKLLSINMGRISRGAELPAATEHHLHAFYRSLVILLLAPAGGKSKLGEEVLAGLAEELEDAAGPAAGDEVLAGKLDYPSWLRLYRALEPGRKFDVEQASRIAHFLAKREEGRRDATALGLVTFLAEGCQSDEDCRLLDELARIGSDNPERWQLLLSDDFCGQLAQLDDADAQRELAMAWIQLLTSSERDAPLRRRLLTSWFQGLPQPADFRHAVCLLARVLREAGAIAPELLAVLEMRGAARVLSILECIRPQGAEAASQDAQFLIGRLLQAHDIAEQEAFQRFCRDIAPVELTVALKSELDDRVFTSKKLKQALINRSLPPDRLVDRLRSTVDRRTELFYLLLLAFRQFAGAKLGEVTRALSLIDVAIRQDKIDARHATMLMEDLKQNPLLGLETLVDEARIDGKAQADQELFLLYLNLWLISQTSDRVETLDLDHLSRTLRKLKIHDTRGRQS